LGDKGRVWEGEYGENAIDSCRKWNKRPVATVLRMGEGIKEDDRGGDSTMIYCKHFCKCHNVPPVLQ
jgi:hypothetical protein